MLNQNPYTQRPRPSPYSAFCAGLIMTYLGLTHEDPLLFLSLAGLFYYSAAWMYLREYRKKKKKGRE